MPRDAVLGCVCGHAYEGLGQGARRTPRARPFGDELKRIGWRGDEPVGARKMHAFFELHIEQGPILEAEGKDIGVVTHGQGLIWTQVTITGKDAIPARPRCRCARMPGWAWRGCWKGGRDRLVHAPHAVGAAGHIDVYPNSRNVIPGKAVFTVDFRSPESDGDRGYGGAMKEARRRSATIWGWRSNSKRSAGLIRSTFDEGCVTAVRNAAERLGYSHHGPDFGRGA